MPFARTPRPRDARRRVDVVGASWDAQSGRVAHPGSPVDSCTQVNLSCNFFRGSFDESKYVEFIGDYFADCDKRGAL